MSDEKTIKIRAVLDASTFDRGVQEIQEKLKKLTQQQTQGAGAQKALGKDGVLGKYAASAFGDFSRESQQEMQKMFQAQKAEAVNQQITLKGKQAELAKMAKLDTEMTKQQKERNENLKKEIELLKEKHRLTLTTAAETQKALDNFKKETGGAGGGAGGPPSGTTPSPQDANGGFKNMLGGMIKSIGVAAIAKGVINASLMGLEDVVTRDRKIGMNNAASMNMGSREMREGMSGQGSRGMFWMPERQRAMAAAAHEQRSMGALDYAKIAGGTAMGAITGAAAGFVGGAGIGAIPGAIGGGIMGFAGIMGNDRLRARMFDQERYKSLTTKEGLEKYEQNLAAEKAKNPGRELARDYFEQNSSNMAAMQKLGGIGSDENLIGQNGILQSNMRQGGRFGGVNFSQQTIQDQMQALASGGAMTSGIRNLAGNAGAYNRQFNLSNSGQTMGRIQGNTGLGSTETNEAYKRLLTEAVKMGVDTSTMPRELEKMTQITAELTTSGGVNASGMGNLFSQGLTGFNDKAMQAAASSAEGYKSTSKAAGDWEGQMGYGFMQSDKASKILGGKKLSSEDMNYLNQTSAAELDEQGFARIAAGLGVDPSQVKEYLTEKDKYKQSRSGPENEAMKALGDFRAKGGDMTSKEGLALDYKARVARAASRGGYAQESQVQQESDINLQSNVAAGFTPGLDIKTAGDKVSDQMRRKETRAANVEEGAVATGDMARMEALGKNLEDFKKAAEGYTKASVEYNKQFELIVAATKSGATGLEALAKHLSEFDEKMSTGNLTSGKPSGQHK